MSLLDKTNLLITPNAVKAGKLYSVIPSNGTGDCTVVRNTTATRVNSSGLIEIVAVNIPRINYLTSGGIPFILDEAQKTNSFLRSEEFDNSFWFKSNATIASNQLLSPSNNLTADLLTSTSANGLIAVFNSWSAQQKTASVFVKKNTSNNFVIANGSITGTGVIFDLVNGTIVSTQSGFVGKIESYGNSYFRCSVTHTATGNQTIILQVPTSGESVFIWGAQLELGGSATSYVPTVASAITRNADVITVSPPAGTVKITTTFSDDTNQVITSIPALFTLPEGLIKQVLMQSSL